MSKADIINVIDCEATCWDQIPPNKEKSEIIEIGIAGISTINKEIIYKASIPIFPRFSKVSQYCTNLTGWTQEELNSNGIKFKKACSTLQNKFLIAKKIWASYGDEKPLFVNNCSLYQIPYPLGVKCIDVGILASIKFSLEKNISLSNLLEMNDLDFDGKPHRGMDDAYNTARLLVYLLWEKKIPIGEMDRIKTIIIKAKN